MYVVINILRLALYSFGSIDYLVVQLSGGSGNSMLRLPIVSFWWFRRAIDTNYFTIVEMVVIVI